MYIQKLLTPVVLASLVIAQWNLAAFAQLPSAQQATSPTVLNNDSIIKMMKAGLTDDLLISTISSSPGAYDASAEGLIALKSAGVSDRVVAAIVQKADFAGPPAPPSPPVPLATAAADVTFGNVKLADAKGKQADAKLIFNGSTRRVVVRVSERDLLVIPYDSIDKFSYEYTKKHRITSGAIVMVFSLGAGAIVMLTSAKSNWLYIDYHDQDGKKTLVLKLEKKDVQKVFDAARAHTGKEVIDLGRGGKG